MIDNITHIIIPIENNAIVIYAQSGDNPIEFILSPSIIGLHGSTNVKIDANIVKIMKENHMVDEDFDNYVINTTVVTLNPSEYEKYFSFSDVGFVIVFSMY